MFTVIGTVTVDLFVSNLTDMPRSEGDEFTVESLVFPDDPLRLAFGGNGAISAFILARLGASVDLCSGLGTDILGDWMAAQLIEAGVGVDRCPTQCKPGDGNHFHSQRRTTQSDGLLSRRRQRGRRRPRDQRYAPSPNKNAALDQLPDSARPASTRRGRVVPEGPQRRHAHRRRHRPGHRRTGPPGRTAFAAAAH